jgi:plastocyanin
MHQSRPQISRLGTRRLAVSGTVAIVILIALISVVGVAFYATSTTSSGSCTTTGTRSGAPSSPIQVLLYSGAANPVNSPGYRPDNVTLVIGVNNTVTWTNGDSAAHTVTSSTSPQCGSFDSGNMGGGASYTHTFTIAGTYNYYCKYHNWMRGTIVVKGVS